MELRSNFEPGTSRWATRRAQWLALGLTDEDMTKPKIAVVNSSSQLAICFSHLDEIARRAKRAIELAGGVAFEVRTAAPSDFITSAGHRGGDQRRDARRDDGHAQAPAPGHQHTGHRVGAQPGQLREHLAGARRDGG